MEHSGQLAVLLLEVIWQRAKCDCSQGVGSRPRFHCIEIFVGNPRPLKWRQKTSDGWVFIALNFVQYFLNFPQLSHILFEISIYVFNWKHKIKWRQKKVLYKTCACCGEYQEEEWGVEEDIEWPDKCVCERGDFEYKVGRWSVGGRSWSCLFRHFCHLCCSSDGGETCMSLDKDFVSQALLPRNY